MSKPSRFTWHDVMTTDVKSAEKFYAAVMGWTMEDSAQPGAPYTIASNGGAPAAGIFSIPDDVKAAGIGPAWMGYIGVDNVEAFAEKLKAEGGAIHRGPWDVPGVGRMAVAGDPHGAGFMLYQDTSGMEAAPAPFMAQGTVGWNELHAGNLDEAFAFYARLFGWEKDTANDMGGFIYQTFKTGGEMAEGGMMTKMASAPMPYWAYYFSVGDIDAGVQRVRDNGGQILMDVMQVPGGTWIAPCKDPQGAHFNLIGMKS